MAHQTRRVLTRFLLRKAKQNLLTGVEYYTRTFANILRCFAHPSTLSPIKPTQIFIHVFSMLHKNTSLKPCMLCLCAPPPTQYCRNTLLFAQSNWPWYPECVLQAGSQNYHWPPSLSCLDLRCRNCLTLWGFPFCQGQQQSLLLPWKHHCLR